VEVKNKMHQKCGSGDLKELPSAGGMGKKP